MLQNISVFHFLTFAVAIGFASAIIYTNIQRTALSKFILFLTGNNCVGEKNAISLDEIGISAIQKRIIESSAVKTHGLKRSVGIISGKADSENKLERMLNDTSDRKYYLLSDDFEELIKKYSYKTMSTKLILLFIAALLAVIIAVTAAVEWLISYVTIPKIEDSEKETVEENRDESSSQTNDETPSYVVPEIPDNSEQGEAKPQGPRIPV